MLIGVFSDVHDNLTNLRAMLDAYIARGIQTLIFCGDFCSPIPLREMLTFPGEIHAVFGNGDGDRFTMLKMAANHPQMLLHGEFAELELGGVKIAVTHYPFYAQALARTGDYQAVFSGHTHEQHVQYFGDCLWLNPGDVMGWKGRGTYAVYDTDANQAEIITL